MSKEEIAANAFAAHPHANEVHVTEDGHFHLNPHSKGTRFVRGEVEEPKVEEPKVEEPKVEEPKVEEPKAKKPAKKK